MESGQYIINESTKGVGKDPKTGEVISVDFPEGTIVDGETLPANGEMNIPERIVVDGLYQVDKSKVRETGSGEKKMASGDVDEKVKETAEKAKNGELADSIQKASKNAVMGVVIGSAVGFAASKYEIIPGRPIFLVIGGGIAGYFISKRIKG